MALDASEVRVAVSGEVHVAPPGTAVPATATAVLDPALKGLGYASEDGVVESYEESTETIRAWQNGAAVRDVVSESDARLAFTMIQTNKSNLELFHKGSKVVSDGSMGYKIDVVSPTPDPRVFVLDVIDGDEHMRIVVHKGEVVERGEVEYVSGGAVAYPVTISCKPVMMTVEGELKPVVFTKLSNSPAWADESV
jgi:hypothetical protein